MSRGLWGEHDGTSFLFAQSGYSPRAMKSEGPGDNTKGFDADMLMLEVEHHDRSMLRLEPEPESFIRRFTAWVVRSVDPEEELPFPAPDRHRIAKIDFEQIATNAWGADDTLKSVFADAISGDLLALFARRTRVPTKVAWPDVPKAQGLGFADHHERSRNQQGVGRHSQLDGANAKSRPGLAQATR